MFLLLYLVPPKVGRYWSRPSNPILWNQYSRIFIRWLGNTWCQWQEWFSFPLLFPIHKRQVSAEYQKSFQLMLMGDQPLAHSMENEATKRKLSVRDLCFSSTFNYDTTTNVSCTEIQHARFTALSTISAFVVSKSLVSDVLLDYQPLFNCVRLPPTGLIISSWPLLVWSWFSECIYFCPLSHPNSAEHWAVGRTTFFFFSNTTTEESQKYSVLSKTHHHLTGFSLPEKLNFQNKIRSDSFLSYLEVANTFKKHPLLSWDDNREKFFKEADEILTH